ncbi:MAG: hypothetical protein NWS96_02335 [Pseudomonadales bacterium]|nr:hypothetical protein [Pseudomonadales bacterium]MDP4639294.1 hypothetical protein [Pseudomonadales bacterium]
MITVSFDPVVDLMVDLMVDVLVKAFVKVLVSVIVMAETVRDYFIIIWTVTKFA